MRHISGQLIGFGSKPRNDIVCISGCFTMVYRIYIYFIGFIFILMFFTWLMLLPGAFYAVQVIRMSILEKKCSPRTAIIHILLQFIFLVDVLDTMYISVKIHNKGKKRYSNRRIIFIHYNKYFLFCHYTISRWNKIFVKKSIIFYQNAYVFW